jgi:outer membrane protein assembly factor BamB
MLKSFCQFAVCASVLTIGSFAIAQNSPVSTRQPDWTMEMKGRADLMATATQLFLVEGGREGEPGPLFAIDPTTGKQLWRSDRPVGQLFAIENQAIYASDFGQMQGSGSLLTLDATTGKTIAVLPLPDRQPDPTAKNGEGDIRYDRLLGVHQGMFIYKSSISQKGLPYRDRVTAQTPTGVRWTLDTEPNSYLFEGGTVQDGVVVLPIVQINRKTDQRSVLMKAIDATTGKLLWDLQAAEDEIVVLADTIYATGSVCKGVAQGRCLKALDLKTGKERWTYSGTPGKPDLVSDREVFLLVPNDQSTPRYLVLDRQTGALLRQFTLAQESQYGRAPRLIGNRIYKESVHSTGAWTTVENYSRIDVFDATNGQLLWQTPLRRGQTSEPAVVSDRLVIAVDGFGSTPNAVLGFKLP